MRDKNMRNKAKLLCCQLVKELEQNQNRKHAEKEKYYHKYDDYKSYGIRTPKFGAILKKYRKSFKELKAREVFELATYLYSSHIAESMHAGNYLIGLHIKLITPQRLNFLDRIASYFNSWSIVDDFCISILQPVLLEYPKETIGLLKKWNKSKNMWKRRASVVAFVRKIGESGKFTDIVLKLCNDLIWDKEDLVRKGVGWALKDSMRGSKKKVLRYVKDLRRKGVNSTIVLYAIRDLKGKEREEILSIVSGR
jgi:3-methyladenine DNA glycosylase AlkD